MMAKIIIAVTMMTMTVKNEKEKSSRSRHLLGVSGQGGIDNETYDDDTIKAPVRGIKSGGSVESTSISGTEWVPRPCLQKNINFHFDPESFL